MTRLSIKIVGASGQGIDSVGEIMAKALKRSGYCVFGYREYPSLIKGGHASYQLDFSDQHIESSETKVNLVLALNHHGLEHNLGDLKPGGILIHSTDSWNFPQSQTDIIERLSIAVICIPIESILASLKAKPVLANSILSGMLWALFGQDMKDLKKMVGEKFAKKKDLLEMNMRCIEEGFRLRTEHPELSLPLPKGKTIWKKQLLLTGSKAMGLGTVHAGVRVFAGYPMTPSSPLLSFIADIQNKTGMVIKQAEDEITAAQMVSGAMFAGTRALTATSGGGFDLMSETLSLNAMIENPAVFVLAQRPGPATGLPTWTGQADLLMAIHTSHGEFARCVLSVSNSQDSFDLMNQAFNLAEEYQINVIVLTDKQIAEGLYTQVPYNQTADIRRGLVQDPEKLQKLTSADRYDLQAQNGVSLRWIPGTKAATYIGQGDEHTADGSVDESAMNAKLQIEKRMKKAEALKAALPEPDLYQAADGEATMIKADDAPEIDVLFIGWGSTKSPLIDAMKEISLENENLSIAYLHYTYLWPLKSASFKSLHAKAKKTVLVEGNYQGQLGMLLQQETGIAVPSRILKYDGRPFFVDELKKEMIKNMETKHASSL